MFLDFMCVKNVCDFYVYKVFFHFSDFMSTSFVPLQEWIITCFIFFSVLNSVSSLVYMFIHYNAKICNFKFTI